MDDDRLCRVLGGRRSRSRCARRGCDSRITRLAERFGDRYCSRACMEADTGLACRPAATAAMLAEQELTALLG